jgi:hypothetical protein
VRLAFFSLPGAPLRKRTTRRFDIPQMRRASNDDHH